MNQHFLTAAPGFVSSQLRTERQELYSSWISEIPENYFKRFLEQGIGPFLDNFGYRLGLSSNQRISMLRAWAFAHVQTQQQPKYYGKYITLLKCAHDGGDEEYDWFLHTISQEEWNALSDHWYSTEFLDDSDPGVSQRLDLPRVIWHMIALEGSRAHQQWLDVVMDALEQEDGVQDDTNIAFTGNRRTFS
jgi:hypothetical protein